MICQATTRAQCCVMLKDAAQKSLKTILEEAKRSRHDAGQAGVPAGGLGHGSPWAQKCLSALSWPLPQPDEQESSQWPRQPPQTPMPPARGRLHRHTLVTENVRHHKLPDRVNMGCKNTVSHPSAAAVAQCANIAAAYSNWVHPDQLSCSGWLYDWYDS